MSEAVETSSPFSARTVGILLAIAIVSFGAVMVLAGWSPELRNKDQAGDHPFSTSALGYNGIVQFLDAQDYPVEISRLEHKLTDRPWGLMVITASPWGMTKALNELTLQEPTLVVLPKWTGTVNPLNRKRQRDTKFASARLVNDLLGALDVDGEIGRINVPHTTRTPFGRMALRPDLKMQVLNSDRLEPIVDTGDGFLLAKLPDQEIYILADPDMLNTFGLAERENARFAVQLMDYLRYDADEPIIFDATLHGFVRSENLLKMMFDIPFVGATLAALASAFLLGWAALVRFGPTAREGRVIALGKQALADNSAGLITMTRREARMAPGYLAMMRRRVAREIAAPKTMTEAQLSALFDRLGPEDQSGKTFSQIERGLRTAATSREDLMTKARELYRWRRDILRRSTHEHK
ncbi:hypothetical protein [Hyphomonas johnsonii]|uniref:DUF4350 domain-containing protein n=1 Tax=Hyphomonas johnsonii MHS-2 TaxID=1280950 RepID=A0A059FVB4_9PROT|nr:hypothetical protein [Hyphomonas johnsonii]KCZ94451.1 hypothetical protein HJO_03715 [Hyphomonas johnsonii MHS-2]